MPLSPESRLLTTFLTPTGRFCFNKLPFGISSASEHFQRKMSDLLADIPGVIVYIDDILIFGETQEIHDKKLEEVLSRIQKEGLTLNKAKCKFSQPKIDFLGHIIDENGVIPDPKKMEAVQKMPPPASLTELRRFMGIVNQLNKFSPRLAELSQPLRSLLSPKQPPGLQLRMRPSRRSKQRFPHLKFWLPTILEKPQRSVPMPLHTDWELSSSSSTSQDGVSWPSPPDHSQMLSQDMLK